MRQVQPGICTHCRHPQHLHPADRGRRCISPLCGCVAFVGEEIEPKLTQQVGGNAPMETDDPLVVLLAALAVLVEDDESHMGSPAVGYLRGRAQRKRDEAPNAQNPQQLELQAKLLEKAAEILEGK